VNSVVVRLPICVQLQGAEWKEIHPAMPISDESAARLLALRERFRLREITVVADRGMVSQASLEAFEKSDPPVRYIVGGAAGLRVFQSAPM
jgi:hypothetical protein